MRTQTIQIHGHTAPVRIWDVREPQGLTPIHFAHANGFPAGVYDKLLQPLSEHRTVYALDHRATWDSSPHTPPAQFSWHDAADDIIAAVEQLSPSGAIGVGHSLGAVATLLAAIKRPDLFKQILLIEPVIFPTRMLAQMMFIPKPLYKKVIPIVQKTLQRRDHWSSHEAFVNALSGKSLFKGFSPEVMMDYALHGLRESSRRTPRGDAEAYTLAFRKTWEAQVFQTPPYIWRAITRLKVPCVVWRGETGDIVPMLSWHKWEKMRPESPVHVLSKLGHMAPLQDPALMAREIQKNILSV